MVDVDYPQQSTGSSLTHPLELEVIHGRLSFVEKWCPLKAADQGKVWKLQTSGIRRGRL